MQARGNALLSALAVGAATGAVVVGLGGRMAMAAVALVTGNPTHLTAGGVLESVGLGALLGLAGGLLLHALDGGKRAQRGVVAGLVLFVVAALVGWGAGRIDLGRPVALLTLAVAALVYIAWGVFAAALLARVRG